MISPFESQFLYPIEKYDMIEAEGEGDVDEHLRKAYRILYHMCDLYCVYSDTGPVCN
jgi:hypothetical protein